MPVCVTKSRSTAESMDGHSRRREAQQPRSLRGFGRSDIETVAKSSSASKAVLVISYVRVTVGACAFPLQKIPWLKSVKSKKTLSSAAVSCANHYKKYWLRFAPVCPKPFYRVHTFVIHTGMLCEVTRWRYRVSPGRSAFLLRSIKQVLGATHFRGAHQ